MRVSVNKKDKGYRYNFETTRIKVFLDGILVDRAITADDELGFVLMYEYNEQGKPIINEKNEVKVKEVFGKVRIEILDDFGKSITIPKIEIKQDPENNDILVLVFSRLRPNQIRRLRLENSVISNMTSSQKAQAIGVLAGAGAEYCCEKYGDVYDPSEVVSYAIDEATKFFTMN